MGSKFLLDLADVCRRTGYPVIEVGGAANQQGDAWKYRSRRSGGYDSGRPSHIMLHHTASPPSADGWPDVNYMLFNPNNSARPTSNLYISRKPTIYVMAGGATNTNGVGIDPCRITQTDSMNTHAIGIEAGNNGVGEPWPEPMLDCYVKLTYELGAAYGIGNAQIHSHFEYAPARKVDPAGPEKYASGAAKWDMNRFRADVAAIGGSTPPPDPGDIMANLIPVDFRAYDSRVTDGSFKKHGEGRSIPIPFAQPDKPVLVNLTAIGVKNSGFFSVSWDGHMSETSRVQVKPGTSTDNLCYTNTNPGGAIDVYLGGDPKFQPEAHIIIDVQGLSE